MEAQGEHILIRKPKKEDAQGVIQLPDGFDNKFAYGRVISIGPKVLECVGDLGEDGNSLAEGDLVVFDHHGVREIELDGKKDAQLVVAHASQVFCTISEEELAARKLPLP